MRQTKIICTIGPVTCELSMLKKLVQNGMNVARLNFSHGDHDFHGAIIDRVKKINTSLDSPIGILLDTTGPEIRTTHISGKLHLKAGDKVKIAVGSICDEKESREQKMICVDYNKIVRDLKPKDVVMLDSGLVQVEIYKKDATHLYGKVLNTGDVANKKHVNLPGIKVDLPSITAKDKKDILFGIKKGVDYIALSFVRSGDDVKYVRSLLKKHKSEIKIIAKVEDRQAVKNLEEIIEASDGVMVARGDLGIEVPMEEVPVIQKKIVESCIKKGKPVIVATHLLESMIDNPVPTRAEVTDITLAVWESTDAIMLSGETTAGDFPIKSVQTMARVAERSEKENPPEIFLKRECSTTNQEIARAAAFMGVNMSVKAIIIPTKTGRTAINVSSFRPKLPIIAITESESVQGELALVWGISAIKSPFDKKDPEKTLKKAFQLLKKQHKLSKGDNVVVVSNVLAGKEMIDAIEIRTL